MHEIVGTTNTTGTESTLLAPTVPRNAAPIEVLKTAAVLARLNEIASKGFSPSALGMYLRCPLDFWLTRGSGIGSDQELSERLGSDVLGEAVHRVLEHIHRPCLDRELDPAMLRDAAGEVRSLLTAELGRTFPLTVLEKGHFRLKMEMASEAMKVHLLAEAERCEDMVSIVRAVEVDLDLVLPSGAKLRGRIDRVEERDGIIHVLDMKTGKVKEELLRLPSLERDDLKPEKDKALQLLIYSALYLGAHPELGMVRAGIIPLQRPSSSDGLLFSIKGESDIHRRMLPAINALIDTLVGEIMDPERSFEHRAQSLWCESCIN